MPDPLSLWLLSDGRPGHVHQAEGLARALSRLRPLRVREVPLALRGGAARLLMRAWLNGGRLAQVRLEDWCHRWALPEGRPDVIVSAGGRTACANAALARRHHVPNLFAGSLRGLSPALFSAVLTLERQADSPSNLVLDVGPTRVDAEALAGRGVTGCDAARPCWALLAGGDGAGYRYRAGDWRALGCALAGLSRLHGVRWLVVVSRRSGRGARRLALALDEAYRAAWVEPGRPDGPGLLDCLAAAQRILVTEDSMTMLSEALSTCKPVYSLRPAHARPTVRYNAVLARWAANAWLARFDIAALARDPALLDAVPVSPLPRPPAEDLAERLRRVLGW